MAMPVPVACVPCMYVTRYCTYLLTHRINMLRVEVLLGFISSLHLLALTQIYIYIYKIDWLGLIWIKRGKPCLRYLTLPRQVRLMLFPISSQRIGRVVTVPSLLFPYSSRCAWLNEGNDTTRQQIWQLLPSRTGWDLWGPQIYLTYGVPSASIAFAWLGPSPIRSFCSNAHHYRQALEHRVVIAKMSNRPFLDVAWHNRVCASKNSTRASPWPWLFLDGRRCSRAPHLAVSSSHLL